ncbi:MAG: hypothetical protein OEW05_00870 [Candidatus Aminicenantes bacterium]|nr:hypothetical protein [Candidatus Aminicenantes bacterium]
MARSSFVAGKTYRLCIDEANPREARLYSSDYRCTGDDTFVFEAK